MVQPERMAQVYRRAFIAALGALSALLLFYMLFLARHVGMMFAVAGLLAYLLAGPIDWLSARYGRRKLFTVAVFIVFVVLLLALFGSFIPIVTSQVSDLVQSAPDIVQQLEDRYIDLNAHYGFAAPEVRLSDYLKQLSQKMSAGSPEIVNRIWGYGKTVLSSTATALSWLFLIPLMTLYLLLDSDRLRRQVVLSFTERMQPNVDTALSAVNHTLGGYIYSRVVLAAVVWVSYTVLLTLFGVPYALLLGILAFIGEFIPVVGNLIAFALIALIMLVTAPGSLIWVTIIIVIIQGVQNYIIAPRIMSEAMDLHPLTVIIVMLMGGTLAGGIGLLLAMPVAAAVKAIVSVYIARRKELGIDLSVVDLVKSQHDGDPHNGPELA